MSRKEKIAVAFSGGKDSTMMLYRLLEEGTYEVEFLIVTISALDGRSTSHKVKEPLIELQARSIGIRCAN
jgi:diphthamide synthase (EF-2-diphthine--ammonia ligase)